MAGGAMEYVVSDVSRYPRLSEIWKKANDLTSSHNDDFMLYAGNAHDLTSSHNQSRATIHSQILDISGLTKCLVRVLTIWQVVTTSSVFIFRLFAGNATWCLTCPGIRGSARSGRRRTLRLNLGHTTAP